MHRLTRLDGRSFIPPLFLTVLLGACDVFGPETLCGCSPMPPVVMLTPASATISVGDTVVINASVEYPYGGTWSPGVSWTVSDPTLLSVLADGPTQFRGVGVAEGSTTVGAQAGDGYAEASVTINAPSRR